MPCDSALSYESDSEPPSFKLIAGQPETVTGQRLAACSVTPAVPCRQSVAQAQYAAGPRPSGSPARRVVVAAAAARVAAALS